MTNLDEFLPLTPIFAGGLVLGVLFHLALWWSVVAGLRTPRSAFWFPASLLLRMAVTVIGFYVLGAGQWERFLACLLGFLVAQLLVIRKR